MRASKQLIRSTGSARSLWRSAGHPRGVALTGDLAFARLKSPLPADQQPAGLAYMAANDALLSWNGFPFPNGTKCAKVGAWYRTTLRKENPK